MNARPFPDDLVRIQRAWTATYQALAACHPDDNTVLRRRLQRLSVRLFWHPHLVSRPAARPALRATADTHAAGSRAAG
ncbi:hypothetical protein OIE71_00065 [Streptomyces sp. NBC_01725]|uniref:hypothetical protein n=1 Tax=Streptomyces sp. NBC_01725 TaxID=2975923 RepID=UPI002E29619A|nr:hypothetical protein [Streptomyces sp. NBC_01725]